MQRNSTRIIIPKSFCDAQKTANCQSIVKKHDDPKEFNIRTIEKDGDRHHLFTCHRIFLNRALSLSLSLALEYLVGRRTFNMNEINRALLKVVCRRPTYEVVLVQYQSLCTCIRYARTCLSRRPIGSNNDNFEEIWKKSL